VTLGAQDSRIAEEVSAPVAGGVRFIQPHGTSSEQIAKEIRRYIAQQGLRPDDRLGTENELATEFGVHRVHLARAFRDHYGTSLSRHLQRARLVRARRLLAATDLTLADVAATAGFADQSHLTRSVRSALGTTPAALRRTLHRFKTAPAPAR